MSDLVGNPEDRFSQNEAHIRIKKRKKIINPGKASCTIKMFVDLFDEHINVMRAASVENR